MRTEEEMRESARRGRDAMAKKPMWPLEKLISAQVKLELEGLPQDRDLEMKLFTDLIMSHISCLARLEIAEENLALFTPKEAIIPTSTKEN